MKIKVEYQGSVFSLDLPDSLVAELTGGRDEPNAAVDEELTAMMRRLLMQLAGALYSGPLFFVIMAKLSEKLTEINEDHVELINRWENGETTYDLAEEFFAKWAEDNPEDPADSSENLNTSAFDRFIDALDLDDLEDL